MTAELEKLTTGNAAFLVAFIVLFGGVQILAHVQKNLVGVKFFFIRDFWQAAATYLPWALFQQTLVLIPFGFSDLPDIYKYAGSTGFFSCVYHLPNLKLMLLTGLFALAIYPFYFGGFISLFHVAALHAIGGAAADYLHVDLRTWWAYWGRDGR